MQIFEDVEIRIKNKNKILFTRDSGCLSELVKLMDKQSHKTLIMWALDCAKQSLFWLNDKKPFEERPRKCLILSEEWAKGLIKMPVAKRAILDCHAAAKNINDSECVALCHAIGHAGATVHVKTHAIGLPLYELTAIVLRYGKDYKEHVNNKIEYYLDRLNYWQENTGKVIIQWAEFLNK